MKRTVVALGLVVGLGITGVADVATAAPGGGPQQPPPQGSGQSSPPSRPAPQRPPQSEKPRPATPTPRPAAPRPEPKAQPPKPSAPPAKPESEEPSPPADDAPAPPEGDDAEQPDDVPDEPGDAPGDTPGDDADTDRPADPGAQRRPALENVLERFMGDGSLTRSRAEAVIAALVAGERPQPSSLEPPRNNGLGGNPRGVPGAKVAAEALGMTPKELRRALRSGQTIAQVAVAAGIDPQTVIDAMVAAAKAKLDKQVAEGEITREEADARLVRITQRITDLVNDGRPQMPPAEPTPETPDPTSGDTGDTGDAPTG